MSLLLLKVLYLSKNKLKRLPESLGNLGLLQTLDVSHNNLKELPTSLAKLTRLAKLNVCANAKLTKLDKSLANVRSLETLELDAVNFTYPEASVCGQGTEAIMKFLCKGDFFLATLVSNSVLRDWKVGDLRVTRGS